VLDPAALCVGRNVARFYALAVAPLPGVARTSTEPPTGLVVVEQAARSILAERGSTATLERVTSKLRAAALSDDARPDLARGRLTQDIAPAGFEAFTGVPVSTARPRKQPAKSQPQRATNNPDRQEAARQAAAKRDAITRARGTLKAARERETSLAKRLREAERAERGPRELSRGRANR